MLAVILVDLYTIHLHPVVKKYFPIVDKYNISMILQPAKKQVRSLE